MDESPDGSIIASYCEVNAPTRSGAALAISSLLTTMLSAGQSNLLMEGGRFLSRKAVQGNDSTAAPVSSGLNRTKRTGAGDKGCTPDNKVQALTV